MKKFILVLTVITVILCGVGIINVSVGAYGGTLGDLYYIVYDNYVEIDGCDLSATSITIPSIIEGKPVTTIGFRAFIDHTKLKSVTIPDTVTVIEDYAFDGCDGLNKVYITNLEAWLNIDLNDDMVIVLASYADGDKFLGFTFKPASDLNLPINNSNGEVKKLKAFL